MRLCLTVFLLLLGHVGARAEWTMPRVRALDPELRAALTVGLRESPTLQRLVADLESSDVIVHIVRGTPDPAASDAALQFVVTTGGYRFLRIRIKGGHTFRRTLGLLGHELQHAREVAGAPSVVDTKSFEALYRQIGFTVDGSERSYETRAARIAGDQVQSETRRAVAIPPLGR